MKFFDLVDDAWSELEYRMTMANYAVDELLGKDKDSEECEDDGDEFMDKYIIKMKKYFPEDEVRKVIGEGCLSIGDTVIPILEIEKYSSFVFGERGIEGQVTPKELRSIELKYGQIKKGRWVVVSSMSYEYYSFYEDDGIDIDELCRKLDIIVMFTALFKGDSGLNL